MVTATFFLSCVSMETKQTKTIHINPLYYIDYLQKRDN